MRAMKCDRCGVYYDKSYVGNPCVAFGSRITLGVGRFDAKLEDIYDLCPRCREKLQWFMNLEKPEEDKEVVICPGPKEQ